MDHMIRYRHNIMHADSVSAFAGLKGGCHQNCRDVYFVRALGGNSDLFTDVQQMDQKLGTSMQEGRLLYKRIRQLPPVADATQAGYYAGCYDNWIRGGQQMADTRVSGRNPGLPAVAGRACRIVLQLFGKYRTGVSDSVRKNFAVKLLYWFDTVMDGFLQDWNEKLCIKIVASDVTKEQEYLFYYMLTLTGCDVMLLQTKADLMIAPGLLELSGSFVLGDYGTYLLPDFEEKINSGPSAEEGGTRPADDTRPGTADSCGSGEPVRVRIPERTGRTGGRAGAGQSGQEEQTVRIHIPERAGCRASGEAEQTSRVPGQKDSGCGTVRSGGTQPLVRVRLPERTGSASGSGGRDQSVCIQPQQQRRGRQGNGLGKKQPAGSALAVSGNGRATDSVQEKSFEELALLGSSVVMVAIHDHQGEVIGTGSGIMAGRNGYILTNNHVAAGGSFYSVRIENDDQVYQTDEVIKYHSVFDLALLRIDRQLQPIPVYRGPGRLVRGQKVVAIGSPLGLFNSISDGIIAGFRSIDGVDMIQFTAPISSGSSGGAVLNMYGEVIGISTAGFDRGQNINLAVGYECINMFIRGFV